MPHFRRLALLNLNALRTGRLASGLCFLPDLTELLLHLRLAALAAAWRRGLSWFSRHSIRFIELQVVAQAIGHLNEAWADIYLVRISQL